LAKFCYRFTFGGNNSMIRVVALSLFFLGAVGVAFAGVPPTPEIDANSAVGAIALLGGAVLVLRARRRSR
jgi:MYXO-CTERM domain-containing protein